VVGLCWASDAWAQYSVPSQASRSNEDSVLLVQHAGYGEPIIAKDHAIPWEIGASLNFLTSEASLGDEKLAFTDVMLLRLHALVSLGDYELFVGSDLLPKQPSYTNELVWQGSLAGVRTSFGPSWSAWLRAQGGPQLAREGYWMSADAAAEHQYALQRELFVESSLGWSHSQLKFKGDVDRPFFVAEAFAKIGLALRDPRHNKFAVWLNFQYFYPILSGPDSASPDLRRGHLAPQPRVNMHMGALGAITENVDLFVEYSILDRGDLEDAPTTLPILNGGFDQRQILFGFMRHFGG
jgi:hypothetical protein